MKDKLCGCLFENFRVMRGPVSLLVRTEECVAIQIEEIVTWD